MQICAIKYHAPRDTRPVAPRSMNNHNFARIMPGALFSFNHSSFHPPPFPGSSRGSGLRYSVISRLAGIGFRKSKSEGNESIFPDSRTNHFCIPITRASERGAIEREREREREREGEMSECSNPRS